MDIPGTSSVSRFDTVGTPSTSSNNDVRYCGYYKYIKHFGVLYFSYFDTYSTSAAGNALFHNFVLQGEVLLGAF